MASQYLKGAYKKGGERLFTMAWNDRTRMNGFKLKESRFTLDIKKKIFTVRVVRQPGSLEKFCMLHPWKCSRPGWMVP